MKHENMKFRVTSPEQSERLQRVLFAQGHKWGYSYEKPHHTDREFLYTSFSGLQFGSDEDRYLSDPRVSADTETFIALHSAVEAPEPFIGLEAAWDGIGDDPRDEELKASHFCPWFENCGEQPVEDGIQVDLLLRSGDKKTNFFAGGCSWNFGFQSDIIKWRYHRVEDYFKAPKTKADTLEVNSMSSIGGSVGNIWTGSLYGVDTNFSVDASGNVTLLSIDSHYNFTYTLTDADREAGTIKIDPYFVAQQWKLGSKDDTGVVFHCLKNLSRYGDKNTKEREIVALYKSVLRLAQLEGVELK